MKLNLFKIKVISKFDFQNLNSIFIFFILVIDFVQWCISTGARHINEIREQWRDFADDLSLKKFERKRLEKDYDDFDSRKLISPMTFPMASKRNSNYVIVVCHAIAISN